MKTDPLDPVKFDFDFVKKSLGFASGDSPKPEGTATPEGQATPCTIEALAPLEPSTNEVARWARYRRPVTDDDLID